MPSKPKVFEDKPPIEAIVKQVYTPEEADEIYEFLKSKNFEYHKPYTRYNKIVKVPRGQASYTLDESIHYDYGKIAGSSPPNEIMCDRLKEIVRKTNEILGRNYNTILMNVYKDGKDAIGFHQDNENGWAEGSGFATLSFGCERTFMTERGYSKERNKILHKNGWVIEMPYPMNHEYYHAVPPCSEKVATKWRISLTLREIITKK
jgi:alkylated DNA repair dioxygenase AlkB